MKRDADDRSLLDGVEDEPVVAVVDTQCPVTRDRRDLVVEFVSGGKGDIPVDFRAARTDQAPPVM